MWGEEKERKKDVGYKWIDICQLIVGLIIGQGLGPCCVTTHQCLEQLSGLTGVSVPFLSYLPMFPLTIVHECSPWSQIASSLFLPCALIHAVLFT